ncbi:hypothetical protein H3222_23690 [Pseudomonas chengduensis]|nr:hypothetical protein [Pseudomonas chengduensis]MBG0848204.1 hypothetical protein [Pseudomonas chengduensis]
MNIPPEVNAAPSLPKIEVTSDGKNFRVDWDYQEAPESIALHDNEYLRGYIEGVITTLAIPEKSISCATPRTGTVRRLEHDLALKLAELLTGALHPVVEEKHRRLRNEANLPHIRFAREAAAKDT